MNTVLMLNMGQYGEQTGVPSKLDYATPLLDRKFSIIPLGGYQEVPPDWYVDRYHDGCIDKAMLAWPKTPRQKWEQYQSKAATQEEIERWWGRMYPDANIAIVCGNGLVVVDLDCTEAVVRATKELPPTPWKVETAKGEHWYYRIPEGELYRNKVNAEGRVDIRGQNGYVVAPGSRHPSGVYYKWIPQGLKADHIGQLPELSRAHYDAIQQWGKEAVTTSKPGSILNLRDFTASNEVKPLPAPAPDGCRNHDLAGYVGHLFEKRLPIGEATTLAMDWGSKCQPPMDQAEILRTVESIWDADKRNHPERHQLEPVSVEAVEDNTYQWPEPDSLGNAPAQAPYPIEALPPIIRDAVQEVAYNVQAPLPVAAGSVLSTCAAAAQSQADVQRDTNLTGPCSLFFLQIFDSGEGKSTVDSMSARVIENYEDAEAHRLGSEIAEERAELKLWQSQMAGLDSKVKGAASGDPEKLAKLKAEYHELDKAKPVMRRLPKMTVEDVNAEGLQKHMAVKWPSVLLNSDEAGILLGGQAMNADNLMKFLAVLNKGYDGKKQQSSRKQVEEHTVSKFARLSLHLMVQPEVLQKSLEKTGALWEGIGFLPRCLIQESPMIEHRPYRKSCGTAKLDRLHSHIERVLDMGLPVDVHGKPAPSMMTLGPEAQVMWQEFHTRINGETFKAKARTGEPGKYADVRKYAARCSDNAVRLATVCSIVRAGTTSGGISADDMRMGMAVSEWHLTEAVRFIGKYSTDPAIAAAMKLEQWLIGQYRSTGSDRVKRTYIQKRSPFRGKEKLNPPLELLRDHARVVFATEGRTGMVLLNPAVIAEYEG